MSASAVLIEPKIAGASIVLIGNFNPAIFSPDWFVRQGLIAENDLVPNDPDMIIHPQVAQFRLDWCQIVAETNRFTISSSKDPLILIADLTVRTFTEYLPHTPISQLGINRQVHFQVKSAEVRDAVGERLAPRSAWGEWTPNLLRRSDRRQGGMTSLTMMQNVFEDGRSGQISTTVQPSNVIESGLGIFVQVNDHYESTSNSMTATNEMMTILKDRFESSKSNADLIIDQVMRLANEYSS